MGEVEQQTFDVAERELIRKKLIRYAKENGIGAGRLATEITASHPRGTELPVSTLQRFLAGRSKNKSCVALCHHFVERRTISDPSAALGERLFIFYGAGNGRDYSGTYRCDIGTTDAAETEFAGHSKINIVADAGFWRVTETTVPDLSRAIYDGVLVCSGDAAVVVLKDRVAGLARSYMLWPENEILHGHGATMLSCPAIPQSLGTNSNFRVSNQSGYG